MKIKKLEKDTEKEKEIENIDVAIFGCGMRMIGFNLEEKDLRKILNLLQAIQEKGGEVTIKDIQNINYSYEDYV